MSLKGLAKETLGICERGRYVAPSGAEVVLENEVAAALGGTVLFTPDSVANLPEPFGDGRPRVEVTSETSLAAARRLLASGVDDVVVLNFASAKNPGGGFLGGAKAQEEDLARCSALYPCQLTQPEYYRANRACGTLLYTDHLIYSPKVPFFRDDRLNLLERVELVSVITSPAPNAGGQHRPQTPEDLEATFFRRGRQVLSVAQHFGHRAVVLGAWGCGAFRNDAVMVAGVFRALLDAHGGAFEQVVFPIHERGDDRPKRAAFESALG